MPVKLAATIKAFQDGITKLAVEKGIQTIESWGKTLQDADFRGAKTIRENLGKLKKMLQNDDLDGAGIMEMLKTLGEETVRASSHAEGKQAEQIKELGELLMQGLDGADGAGQDDDQSEGSSRGKNAGAGA